MAYGIVKCTNNCKRVRPSVTSCVTRWNHAGAAQYLWAGEATQQGKPHTVPEAVNGTHGVRMDDITRLFGIKNK